MLCVSTTGIQKFFTRSLKWGVTSKSYQAADIIVYDNKTAELSQRRPRDAPNIWVP